MNWRSADGSLDYYLGSLEVSEGVLVTRSLYYPYPGSNRWPRYEPMNNNFNVSVSSNNSKYPILLLLLLLLLQQVVGLLTNLSYQLTKMMTLLIMIVWWWHRLLKYCIKFDRWITHAFSFVYNVFPLLLMLLLLLLLIKVLLPVPSLISNAADASPLTHQIIHRQYPLTTDVLKFKYRKGPKFEKFKSVGWWCQLVPT